MPYKPVGADETGHFPPRVETRLNATFVPKWKASTAYLAGDKVISPYGDIVFAKVDFTSGATFNAANWNGATFGSAPSFLTGITSRGAGPGSSRQITVKPNTDTTDGLFDWNHDSGSGYLFHLTMGPNTTGASFAIAIGLDNGLGKGILLANKKTGMGMVINQMNTITSSTAYGVQGLQNSTLAPLMSLEQYVAGAASLVAFRSSINTPSAGQKLIEFTGQPGGTFTIWGNVSAVDGSLNWSSWINANGGVLAYRTNAGDITWQTGLAADNTNIANYRARMTANGALTWSDGAGLAGPSLSRNGTALSLNNVFQFNGGLRWGVNSLTQTTVGAAGAAAALPATPSKYLKIQDETGATFVIPAYAAA